MVSAAGTILFAGLLALSAAGPSDADVAAWVPQRIQDWQPTADEKRFDEIGWAPSIREAECLALLHRRPVFLFTHDGHIAVGRC